MNNEQCNGNSQDLQNYIKICTYMYDKLCQLKRYFDSFHTTVI